MIARLGFGALSVLVFSLLLVAWARRLDQLVTLPALGARAPGVGLALAGVGLILVAARDLWVAGNRRHVLTGGADRLLAHPIYTGAVLVALGSSLASRSAAGLWIVTPTLVLAICAWVLGRDRAAIRYRNGTTPTPLTRLPPAEDGRPTPGDRASIYLLVLVPWLVAYRAVEILGTPSDAVSGYLGWEKRVPVIPWTVVIYTLTYGLVVVAPLVARERRALRRLGLRALWATALITPFYLVAPIIAEAKPVPGSGFLQDLMRWQRLHDPPITAFPAFHVIWTWLAVEMYATRWPRLRWLWWGTLAAVAASCVTTGVHSLADVVAAFLACALIARGSALWRRVCRAAEAVANWWRERKVGRVRFLGHGVFAALGAVSGLIVAASLVGSSQFAYLCGMWAASVVGAALCGQLVKGFSKSLRPYSYFGSVAGGGAVVLAASAAGADAWVVLAGSVTGATVAQGIGRLWCLTQGCCHGRQTRAGLGIRYLHPQSPVVRLAHLAGVPLHPTPVYSLLWTLFVGAVMWRLWVVAAPLQFIGGLYFILIGAGRFVEEHYRGTPHTPVVAGFRLPQWLAMAFVFGGATMTALGATPAPAPAGLEPSMLPALVAVGLATYAAYGADYPASSRRFARLA